MRIKNDKQTFWRHHENQNHVTENISSVVVKQNVYVNHGSCI